MKSTILIEPINKALCNDKATTVALNIVQLKGYVKALFYNNNVLVLITKYQNYIWKQITNYWVHFDNNGNPIIKI